MKNALFWVLLAGAAGAAVPSVSNVTLVQDAATRLVTVTYDIADADAIITLDVTTNEVSVGDWNLTVLSGDVNRLVTAGTGKKIVWNPDAALAPFVADAKAMVNVWTESNPPDYLAVNLNLENDIRYYTSTNAMPYGGLANDCYRKDILLMRRIPAKDVTWYMGQRLNESGGSTYSSQETRHKVTLTNDFWIGVYEFTQGQWRRMMPDQNDSYFTNKWYRDTRPVEKVSYAAIRGTLTYTNWPISSDVDLSCVIGRLRAHSGLDMIDLPTDAQWEFACRAGTAEGMYTGYDMTNQTDDPHARLIARYQANGGGDANTADRMGDLNHGTAKVGTYLPNSWGLYDMLGNVYEWCLDRCDSPPLMGSADAIDPVGPSTGDYRIRHGGSWGGDCRFTRAAYRGCSKATESLNSVGFRVAARIW